MRGVAIQTYYDQRVTHDQRSTNPTQRTKPLFRIVLGELFVNCCVKFAGMIPERMRIEVGGNAGEQMFSVLHRVDTECRWGPMNRLRSRLANFCLDPNGCLLFDMAVPLTRKEMILEALRTKGYNTIEEFKERLTAHTKSDHTMERPKQDKTDLVMSNESAQQIERPEQDKTALVISKESAQQMDKHTQDKAALVNSNKSDTSIPKETTDQSLNENDFERYENVTFDHKNLRSWYRVRRFRIPILKLMALVDSLKGLVRDLQAKRAKTNEVQGRNLLEDGSVDSQKAIIGDEPLYLQWVLTLKDLIPDAKGDLVDDTIWMRAPAEGYTQFTRVVASEFSLFAPWSWLRWWREFVHDNAYSLTPEMLTRLIGEYHNLFSPTDKDWKPLLFHGAFDTALWELDYRQLKRYLRAFITSKEATTPPAFTPTEVPTYPSMHQLRQNTFMKREAYRALEQETQGMVGGDIVKDDVMADGLLQDEYDV